LFLTSDKSDALPSGRLQATVEALSPPPMFLPPESRQAVRDDGVLAAEKGKLYCLLL